MLARPTPNAKTRSPAYSGLSASTIASAPRAWPSSAKWNPDRGSKARATAASIASAKAGFRSTPRYQIEIETRSARSVRQRLWDAEQDTSFHGRCRASDVIVISHDPFLNPDVVRGLNGH